MQLSKFNYLFLASAIASAVAFSPLQTAVAAEKANATQTVASKKATEKKAATKKKVAKKETTKKVATKKVATKKATSNKNQITAKKSVKSQAKSKDTAKKASLAKYKQAKAAAKSKANAQTAKAKASQKSKTAAVQHKNETKQLYGVKGAKLAHVKVSNKKYSYQEKGKTHTTIGKERSRQFSQSGTASYYGEKFHGRKTANGEIFNKNAFTAAHKTLALGSYALVTNQRNGRKVIVRINDRGPFSKSRVIDLSVAAAREIGMLRSGVAQVKIEAMQVDRHGYISGKGAETLYQIAKRTGLPLKVKGEGKNLAIKAK